MRILWIGLVLTSSMAMASDPAATQPAAASAAAQPAEAAPAAPKAAAEPMTVQEAKKAGYKIVNENGKTVYCRDQLKTGSHVRKETICLTAEEMVAAREASRRNLDQMQKAVPPPWGK